MERSEGGSITEGIGQGRVTGNLATCEGMIDGAFLVRGGGGVREVCEIGMRRGPVKDIARTGSPGCSPEIMAAAEQLPVALKVGENT